MIPHVNRIRGQPMCRTAQWATFRSVHVCISSSSLFTVLISIRAYLVVATFTLSLLGYQHFLNCLGISYQVWTYPYFFFVTFIDQLTQKWEHNIQEFMFAMIYILSVVLCFAVGVMLAYHFYGIIYGETSVEAQDHEVYRRQAKARNEVINLL